MEENVTLQKQLIKLERQYLKSMMKTSPITQIKGGCKCQWEMHMREHFAVFLTNSHTLCLHVLRGSDRSGGAEERDRGAEGESAGGGESQGFIKYAARKPQVRGGSQLAVVLTLAVSTHSQQ